MCPLIQCVSFPFMSMTLLSTLLHKHKINNKAGFVPSGIIIVRHNDNVCIKGKVGK